MVRVPIPRRATAGFSLIEVLTVVGVLAIVAFIGSAFIGDIQSHTRTQKLENDIQTVNTAVSAYLTFGGNVETTNDFATVLGKLKSRASDGTAQKVIGFTGAFVDPRLEPVMQTAAEAATDMPRARWDSASSKLVVTTSGPPGFKEFRLNAALAEVAAQQETRQTMMDYATESSWVWDYQDFTASTSPGPTVVSVADDPESPFPPPYPTPPPPIPPLPPKTLLPPVLSPPPGGFPITDFNLTVGISNPNPAGSSTLIYCLDYGSWEPYSGTSLSVSPGQVLKAQALPVDPAEWESSTVTEGTYSALPVQLIPPNITLSDPEFDPPIVETVTVTLDNPNDPAVSRLDYRIDGGTWQTYSGPVTLTATIYPTGAQIEAFAASTGEYWLDSTISSAAIGPGSPTLPDPLSDFCNSDLTNYGSVAFTGLKVSGPDSHVLGDVGIGPGAKIKYAEGGSIDGNVYVDPTADLKKYSGSNPLQTRDFAGYQEDAIAFSNQFAALAPTQSSPATISGNTIISTPRTGGLTVLYFENLRYGIHLKRETLTIHGGPDDWVVLNIAGDLVVGNKGVLKFTGGIPPSHVLVNILPGGNVDLTSSGATSSLGTILAPDPASTVKISGSSVMDGAVIAGGRLSVQSSAQLNGPGFTCF